MIGITLINANLVKELRTKTGVGMMDCKKALKECNGDLVKASEWLRKKGLATAGKKSAREAKQGVIAIHIEDNEAVIIELNSETDFVSKNEKFLDLADNIAKLALKFYNGNLADFLQLKYLDKNDTVEQEIAGNIAIIGENISLKRIKKITVKEGIIAHYIHNKVTDTIGHIGVLLSLDSAVSKEKLQELGKQLAMHIAAVKPESLTINELDSTFVEKEKKVLREQAKESGKPEQVIEKMIEGRMRKFYEQVVFVEQPFIIDGKTKVANVIKAVEKDSGNKISLSSFARFAIGE